jgi:hypothetical protein
MTRGGYGVLNPWGILQKQERTLPPGDTHRPCHHCESEWKDKLVLGLGLLLRCTSYTRRILQWRVEGCTIINSLPIYRLFPLSCPWAGQRTYIFHVVFENLRNCNVAIVNYLLPINYCFCKANDNGKHKKLQQSWKFLTFSLNIHNIEYFNLKAQSFKRRLFI